MTASRPHQSRDRLPTIAVLLTVLALVLGTLSGAASALPGDGYTPPDLSEGEPDTPAVAPIGGFDWHVPERFTQKTDGRYNWRYDEASATYHDAYVRPTKWPVNINGCQTATDAASPNSTANTYTFVSADGQRVSGNRCTVQLSDFPDEGSYEVRMTVTDPDGSRLVDAAQTVVVKDMLIVVLGDSYASGEGNPEYRRGEDATYGDWVDDRCHRSSWAGSAQAARELERSDPKTSVTFVSFACSGATINRDYHHHDETYESDVWDPYKPGNPEKNVGSGVLGPYMGTQPPDPSNYADKIPSQIDQLRSALALDTAPAGQARQVDALVMSAGGNDAGFGILAAACLVQDSCNAPDVEYTGTDGTKVTLATRVAQDLTDMPGRYRALNDAIAALPNLEIADTYVTEYPDPGTELDADGNVVECGEILEDVMWGLGLEIEGTHDWSYPDSELGFARRAFLGGLNRVLDGAANDFGWHLVGGISDGFAGHGYCVGDNDKPHADRYVRTAAMSAVYQGPDAREKNTGSLHPNEAGQRVYRDRILAEMRHRITTTPPDGNITTVFDRTPPTVAATVEPAANAAGWHAGPLTVNIQAQAGGTNTIAYVEHQLDGGAWQRMDGTTASVAISGDGDHTIRYRAVDLVENVSAIGSTTVSIDTQDPTANVVVPVVSAVHILGEAVTVDYRCSDDRSGVASCSGPVTNGGPLDTASVGAHSFIVDAVDVAGNDARSSVSYQVTYDVCPLFVQDRSYKSGQAVPIRLQLCDVDGRDVSSADIVVTAVDLSKVDDAATVATIDDTGNANPSSGFRYDESLPGYVYNLSTKGLSSGTWKLTFKVAGDGVAHGITFDVR